MPAVAAGDLSHRITLQQQERTQDESSGEMVTVWVDLADVWAQIVPMSGREFIAASAEQSEVRGRMVIRYRDDINASMRVVYRGQKYDIAAVLPDNDSGVEHLTLMTTEGVRL